MRFLAGSYIRRESSLMSSSSVVAPASAAPCNAIFSAARLFERCTNDLPGRQLSIDLFPCSSSCSFISDHSQTKFARERSHYAATLFRTFSLESQVFGLEYRPRRVRVRLGATRWLRWQHSPLQINTAARFRCSLEENHEGGHEPAAICRPCC